MAVNNSPGATTQSSVPTATPTVIIAEEDNERSRTSPSVTMMPEPRPITLDRPMRRSPSLGDLGQPDNIPEQGAPLAYMTSTVEAFLAEEPAVVPLMLEKQPVQQDEPATPSDNRLRAPPDAAEVVAGSSRPEASSVRVMYRVTSARGSKRHTVVWHPPRDFDEMSFDDVLREIPLRLKQVSVTLRFILTDNVSNTWEEPVGDPDTFAAMKQLLHRHRDEYAAYLLGSTARWFFVFIEEV